ncbi:hypothetical protein [Pseudomonas pseudonitroreducens]|uniref:hypothetical protein n=1 Tax=Pseudomonas pseudonitroreducens TaxID=2892326 RepID=UPI001F491252|nr:hypothetical protein [Pseudomonas pseudonitroreducens]
MPWYSAGTVAVTNNSPTVTGSGTAFSANARVGDAFRGPDGRWYEVTNVASATVFSIKPNYQGANNAAGSYAIAPMQGYVKDSADALRGFVNQYGTTLASIKPWATAATPDAAKAALEMVIAKEVTSGSALGAYDNGVYQFTGACTELPVAGVGFLCTYMKRYNGTVADYIVEGMTNARPSRRFSNRYIANVGWLGWKETLFADAFIGPWITPTLLNGWQSFSSATTVQYRMVPGAFELRGLLKSGTTGPNSAALALPAGIYQRDLVLPANSADAFASLRVSSPGYVIPYTGSSAYFSLDGIRIPQ